MEKKTVRRRLQSRVLVPYSRKPKPNWLNQKKLILLEAHNTENWRSIPDTSRCFHLYLCSLFPMVSSFQSLQ